MDILLIEDDQHKARQIEAFLAKRDTSMRVTLTSSVNSGMRALAENKFNLVLMDMSLPTFDIKPGEPGGRPQGFGGLEVLRFMERKALHVPVIVVTQFDKFGSGPDEMDLLSLEKVLREEHPNIFRRLIFFNNASESWKGALANAVEEHSNKE
jgi:CheY-like chemotaxis protein